MFKKIHEGLDLFNYYFSRHEASNNDSQREKLEGDLKKEIKRLQKFRDQIKTWQGNDSLEATIALLKLQEHRRLVEEAMECYKEVEKNSKMKSFSNQSIMLALLENGAHMTPEAEECVTFLAGTVESLEEQNVQLDEEYERLSQKKVRKNNAHETEERKLELELFKLRNELHIEKIQALVRYLKMGRLLADQILTIKEDLVFYVELNQEPDFIHDELLFDELFKEARENSENNVVVAPEPNALFDLSLSQMDDDEKQSLPSALPAPALTAPTLAHSEKARARVAKPELEPASPAFVTTLKPSAAPPKPVGALKWSVAAAAAVAEPKREERKLDEKLDEKLEEKFEEKLEESALELLSLLTKNEYSGCVEVLRDLSLAAEELALFSSTALLRAPPGIQQYMVAATAAKCAKPVLLRGGAVISKPYLPALLASRELRPPALYLRLQTFWNHTRATDGLAKMLKDPALVETWILPLQYLRPLAHEAMLLVFFGYYYGYTPLENVVAEHLLHLTGWRPYALEATDGYEAKAPFLCWVRSAGLDEYQVFVLPLWEIHTKPGFKFDPRRSRSLPSKSLI